MSTSKEDNGNNPAPPAVRMRPVLGHDNKWWWDRINEGELPIQRCKQCGTLHHPPRPMCWKCQSLEWDYIVSSGRGTVYSYVVVHRPVFPGYDYPIVVAVIDLEEGTRPSCTSHQRCPPRRCTAPSVQSGCPCSRQPACPAGLSLPHPARCAE